MSQKYITDMGQRSRRKNNIKKRSHKMYRKGKQGGTPVPEWVSVVNYRTMNDTKKMCAAESGCHACQIEWMREEINEFYEAVSKSNRAEIEDEAMGLIRTYQQFQGCSVVVELWKQVRDDVLAVFSSRAMFEAAFDKWHKKKLAKKQAIGVKVEDLIHEAGLVW